MRPVLHLFIFVTLACAIVLRAEEPFSFERTPGRLPKDIVPRRYAIRIEPDIEKATLRGQTTIEIEVRKPVRKIVLNSLGLEIEKATLQTTPPIPLEAKLDKDAQTLSFDLANELPAGKYPLAIEYRGVLNEQTEGLYLTKYQVGDTKKTALTTQFEATDARRMVPCWDEPAFRASFQLTAVVPEKLTAISNMPVERETKLGGGLKEIAFAPTPSMVSYLLAFSTGEFEALRDQADGIELRVYFTEGKREQARYAMEATKQLVPYFNEYFGTKYPLPKLDQISFASTAASGMENWGLIIYNDTALLYDPKTSSQAAKERVYAVIAHEIAHQWFGDLVTMAWWDNLWLNEGFASWMGTKATDHFNPDWKVWLRAAGDKEWAMALDARATTHPIQQPVTNEAQAFDVFDEITYNKGQAFIRMLETYLGEEPFRAGLRRYMEQHQFSNTTTADLWIALEKASGKEVREFAAGWTEQPGFPVVKVSQKADATALTLTQERFTLTRKDERPLAWKIPVRLGPALTPAKAQVSVLGAAPVDVPWPIAETWKVNLGDVGYYRAEYAGPLFARLLATVAKLNETDRLNLLNDTWALVQAGRIAASTYLDLAARLAGDESCPVIEQIAFAFAFIDELSIGRSERAQFREHARQILQPQLAKLGWDAKPGECKLDDLRRNAVIGLLGRFDDGAVLREAQRRFATSLDKPQTLTGDLRNTVWWIVGRHAAEKTYAQLHDLGRKTDSIEQKRALYNALAASRNPVLIEKTLSLALGDELPPQQATRMVQRVAQGSEQPELAWQFAQKHRDALYARLSAFEANDFVADIFKAFTDASRADDLESWSQKNLPPTAANATAKAADAIRFKAALKERLLPEIDAWCRAQPRP